MESWIQLLTAVISAIGSSGLTVYLVKRLERKDAKSRILLGLAHDRLMSLGQEFIEREGITADEYENMSKYLYEPYKAMGGNGAVERIMGEVNKLPIVTPEQAARMDQQKMKRQHETETEGHHE